MHFFTIISAIVASGFALVSGQACGANEALAYQMQQVQQLMGAQMTQLQGLAGIGSPAQAVQYMEQLNQINRNLGAVTQQLQAQQFPSCVYSGYPWAYYGNGVLGAYYGQQQWWSPLWSMYSANAYDLPTAQNYLANLQAQNAALANMAAAGRSAFVV